jgi:phage-related protein
VAVLTYEPYDTTKVEAKPGTVNVRFGDGYSQRQPSSINNLAELWSLLYADISDDDAQIVEDFFSAHSEGQVITWTPPSEVDPRKFVCRKYSRKYSHYLSSETVTATLQEVFQ